MAEVTELINDSDSTTIRLPSVVSINEAQQLRDDLIDALESNKCILIDGSHIRSIDAAGLQILTAFVEEFGDDSKALYWCGVSTTLTDNASLLGLTDHLLLSSYSA